MRELISGGQEAACIIFFSTGCRWHLGWFKDKIECLEEAVITWLGENRLGAGVLMERKHTEISPCVDLTVWASSEEGESMRNRESGSHLKHG